MKAEDTSLFTPGLGQGPINETEGRETTEEMIEKTITDAVKTISLGNYF